LSFVPDQAAPGREEAYLLVVAILLVSPELGDRALAVRVERVAQEAQAASVDVGRVELPSQPGMT
jgi:hypothetical protein